MSLKLLDLGCNFPARALTKHLQGEKIEYTGIELAPESITKEPVFGLDYLKFQFPEAVSAFTNQDGTWKKLPDSFKIHFNTQILDWLNKDVELYNELYLSNILHELPFNWKEIFDKSMLRLKKDGWVYVSVYYEQAVDKEFYLTMDDLVYLKRDLIIFREEQNGSLRQFWAQKK